MYEASIPQNLCFSPEASLACFNWRSHAERSLDATHSSSSIKRRNSLGRLGAAGIPWCNHHQIKLQNISKHIKILSINIVPCTCELDRFPDNQGQKRSQRCFPQIVSGDSVSNPIPVHWPLILGMAAL